ncbi:hypothetical protein MPTK1_5g08570 [Marchantia polymorpha subsp. ruderalis]|uniref:NADP-dependent oxidoreductase domain-containing protein n=2 Tax=Marchantia polymorpha TaxID=3197 RepID=A0A176VSN9_MARPO|nr:hypothetical protein AXG93_369s1240 [Marchantia polymorpha subsp. ruderalis]PTQ33743.1 hypothetical protein MARPO_0086s0062 [Marchantia polymorpha]BBN11044.1 hypothetical protein Mp_5g08570 [Marchantia polymorpha subsp. ruderalis]|eukprot:PTQ33743.1 hypothetical protein MARPO_0086s0062 [Marchantia polymorpha]
MGVAGKQLRVKLNNGQFMPAVATGTAPMKEMSPEFVIEAIEVGYRHFDTAAMYGIEAILGKGLQQAFTQGLVKREDIFVTTKLWVTDLNAPDIVPSLKKCLSALQLEYVDMFVPHWPVRIRPGSMWFQLAPEDFLPLDLPACWKAFEECVHLGLTKGIGAGNCGIKNLKLLMADATIPPAINQIERHPGHERREIVEFCQKHGIHVQGWAALGAPNYGVLPLGAYGTNVVLESPILIKIGAKYGKTSAQVALRWNLDQGCSVVVRSTKRERMAQNLDLFDFSLTPQELVDIRGVEPNIIDPGTFFVSAGSPYKTPADMWAED